MTRNTTIRYSRRFAVRAALALGIAIAAVGASAVPAQAAIQPKITCSETISAIGFSTQTGNVDFNPSGLCLSDGVHRLIFQTDGNLVLYTNSTVDWASNTATTTGHIALQTDGNVVIYNSSGRALWASASDRGNYPEYFLVVEGSTASVYGDATNSPRLWHVS